MTAEKPILLIVNLPPELEESFIDWLLEQEHISSFISQEVRGHRETHEEYSQAEKVRGNKRLVQFQVVVTERFLKSIEQAIENEYGGTPIFYWAVPMVAQPR